MTLQLFGQETLVNSKLSQSQDYQSGKHRWVNMNNGIQKRQIPMSEDKRGKHQWGKYQLVNKKEAGTNELI